MEDLKGLIRLQDTLQKSLKSYFNELGLTTQSRAKLASMQIQREEEKADPGALALAKYRESQKQVKE